MATDSIIGINDVKQLQLEVLQALHSFCHDNHIPYSMACGTLLGAVRHKGYIPWDDDIDIYLLRVDYERLVSLFPRCYKNCYELVSLERNQRWDRPYAKLYDNRTIVREYAFCNIMIGVGIDVYPIDDVPDNEREWKRYDKYRRILQKALSIKRMRYHKKRGFLKNLQLCLLKIPVIFLSRRRFAKIADVYSQKNNNKDYNSVFECVQGLLQKNKFRKDLFRSLSLYEFEGRYFYGFSDYDSYLSNGYGDYMQLPPIEKRIIHHNYVASWL